MIALNENSWYDQDTHVREDELGHERIATADRNPDNLDDDELEDTDDIEDDELDTAGDDLDTDDDAEADDDLLNEDDEDDTAAQNTDFINDADPDALPEKQEDDNEIPEQGESDDENLGYPHQTEVEQQDNGNDASYSEQNDVSPPKEREFPSEGHAKTDFASRNQGRTTGRMVGHEPGTEGI